MKKVIIISLSGVALYLLYYGFKKSQESLEVKKIVKETAPEEIQPDIICAEGEILCDKKNKCYNPSARYIVDPCN
jgi:hypothetical protein